MSKHNVRGTASGEYECSCGARWDRDEGEECPLGRIDGKQVTWQNETMENARVAALNGTLPEPKEVVGAGESSVVGCGVTNRVEIGVSTGAASTDDERASRVNDWFLSLPPERQAVLRDDKWLLADAAFIAGQARAALSANHSEKQAKDAPYMSDDADPRETWAQGYNAAMRNA